MKPFNLEQAKAGKPVCTTDGTPVRILCFDRRGTKYAIVGLVGCNGQAEDLDTWTTNGDYRDTSSKKDLRMAPEMHEGWVNLYRDFSGTPRTGSIFSSEDAAKRACMQAGSEYITTVRVEWEE